MDMSTARCKSCKALVIWALREEGKMQIVDAAPVEPGVTLDRNGKPIREGNLALEHQGELDEYGNPCPSAVHVGGSLFGPEERYVDHHVTCPNWAEWTPKHRDR